MRCCKTQTPSPQPEGEVDLLPMEEGEDEGNDSHVRRDYILR